MKFETEINKIMEQLDTIDPIKYARTRNFINGKVTYLSPYISRGVISLPTIAKTIMSKGFKPFEVEKFIQELAWREYYQRVWQAKGDELFKDLKSDQTKVAHHHLPTNIVEGKTNIAAIDTAINQLYETGYMHNHVRMYIAGITCNVGQSHWLQPARWMYYHLIDADWASNALSWQWVAGSFSSKKYIANQENINKYMFTKDTDTFLDTTYEAIEVMQIPEELKAVTELTLVTPMPTSIKPIIDSSIPTCIYNMYNLDADWMSNVTANRILLLEPSMFEKYPVSKHTIDFLIELGNNIDGLQIVVDEFANIQPLCGEIFYKEHPTNLHYTGVQHQREWMFPEVSGYHNSFFSYWKKCERYFKKW